MPTEQVRYPGQAWEVIAAPEELGCSGEHLSRAKAYAESIGSLR